MSPAQRREQEAADRRLTVILRQRTAEWVRRYTIEQCALIAERVTVNDDGYSPSKTEMLERATQVSTEIRKLARERRGHPVTDRRNDERPGR